VLDADEEAFEDNAEEYMRRDVEGSGRQPVSGILFYVCELAADSNTDL